MDNKQYQYQRNSNANLPVPLEPFKYNDDILEEHLRSLKRNQIQEVKAQKQNDLQRQHENILIKKIIGKRDNQITYDYNGQIIVVQKNFKINDMYRPKENSINPVVTYGKTYLLEKNTLISPIISQPRIVAHTQKLEDFIQDQVISNIIPTSGVQITNEDGRVLRGENRSPDPNFGITKKEYDTMIRYRGNYDYASSTNRSQPEQSTKKPQDDPQDYNESLKKRQTQLLNNTNKPTLRTQKNSNIHVTSETLINAMLFD